MSQAPSDSISAGHRSRRSPSVRNFTAILLSCVGVLILAVAISPTIGTTTSISLIEAWSAIFTGQRESELYVIVTQHRLPRAALAMLVGSTLGLCGAVFQGLFRNPLATPYTLGVASGGSLGALLAIKFGLSMTILGATTLPLVSFIGSLAVLAVVSLWTGAVRRRTGNELLLAGVAMGMFCSAAMMFVTYLADERDTFQIVRWMMGSLDTIGHGDSTLLLPFLLPSWLVLLIQARVLDQYAMGDELAASRGVSLIRLQSFCVGFGALAISAVVAVCGPIGFVDLIVPQAVRRVTGDDHRLLLPVSAMIGGVFLILCDWLSVLLPGWYGVMVGRPLTAATLPIGVITALIGAPVFLWMLRRT